MPTEIHHKQDDGSVVYALSGVERSNASDRRHVRHRRIQPQPRLERRSDARGPGASGRDRRARRRRGRVRVTAAQAARSSITKLRGGASALLDEIAVPAETRAGAHPRPRLHEGPSRDRGQQPPRSGTALSSGSTTASSRTTTSSSPATASSAHEPEMTVDSEAIFALDGAPRARPHALPRVHGAMAAAWLDERDPATLYRRARRRAPAVARPDGDGPLLRVHAPRARDRRALRCGSDSPRARCARDACCASSPVGSSASAASGPTARIARTATLPPVRAPAGGRLLPRSGSLRSPRPRLAARPASRPAATSTPSSRSRSRTRYWNAVQAPRGDVEQPVDLPLRQQRASARRAAAQSAIFGRRPSSPRERGALLDRALEALLPSQAPRSRPRAARPRASRTCARRATPTAAHAARAVEVARRRRPPELVAEVAQLLEQLLARREPPREEPGRALGGVPGAEVLDHRLRVDARLRVGANSRIVGERPSRSALAELVEDLVVGVPPAKARSECGERRLVDARLQRACGARGRAMLQAA